MAENQKNLEVEVFWAPVVGKEKFKEKAEAITSENRVGEFDILPSHANFISLIFNSLTVKTTTGEEESFEFSRGVLRVANNEVRIFLEV